MSRLREVNFDMDVLSKNVQMIDKKFTGVGVSKTNAIGASPGKFDGAAARKLLEEINKELGGEIAEVDKEK